MSSPLFLHLFSTPDLERIFGSDNMLATMIEVEATLAESQRELGIIPINIASIIRAAKPSDFSVERLAIDAAEASNLAVPFVKALTALVNISSPEAAAYVHYGATSQDILDTSLTLQLREAIDLIEVDLTKLAAVISTLANRHKATVMPARTLLQQAMPTTFGLKLAGLLDALMRHKCRLKAVKATLFTLQLGGAAGTVAGYGGKAEALTKHLAHKLHLTVPLMPFHGHRDRMLEGASILASLTITLGKFAGDIALLMQTEIGEVFEGAAVGRGGSSAMPHKRNPALSTLIIAGASQVGGLMATLYSSGMGEHERAAGSWQSEWATLPTLVKLTACVTARSLNLISGLEVNADKMRANLDITLGLVYSEKLKSALVPLIGRNEAHLLLEKASKLAISQNIHLTKALPEEVYKLIDITVLNDLFDPLKASGDAVRMTESVLNEYKRQVPVD